MELKFNLVGNATWTINVDNKFKIGSDPTLAPKGTKYVYKGLKTSKVKAPVYNNSTFENVALWLLTHGHFDHIDKQGVDIIEQGVKIISHKNCAKILKDRPDLDINYISWNESKTVKIENYTIYVKAIHAVHGVNFLAKPLMGGVNGYLMKINDGKESKTIYITSDAVFSQDIVSSIGNEKIDVMVANMGQAKEDMFGGPFTMNSDMLKEFMYHLNPKLTLLIHIDDCAHFCTVRSEIKKLENDKLKVLDNGETVNI